MDAPRLAPPLTGGDITKMAERFIATHTGNCISEHIAISSRSVGLKIFDQPLFAFGAPDDALFVRLREPEVIGPHVLAPDEWLTGAQTVIAFFLPFTAAVREANKKGMSWPAEEWLHARIEGQALLAALLVYLREVLTDRGYSSVAPQIDGRFCSRTEAGRDGESGIFTSNWSERHVAYICGLGTFGLSRGLITEKGVAGRFGSLVTRLFVERTQRPYTDLYAYCLHCGVCVGNCPARAISIEKGKAHSPCAAFLDRTLQKHSPRYGCGKCQVKVPCEAKRPRVSP
ncbi:MAG: hypothetical protein LBN33_10175 [Desulfovibrio sp.]|jgi:epoxyqueuosine reductase QueG|nr:hypothetical protein [Desulfovibrio sp.]